MTKEREYFIENLATLLSSGMGISLVLESVGRDIKSGSLRKSVLVIREEIESGSPIWKALERSGIAGPSTISLIKIGEESGRLSENLKLVVEQQQKDRLLRSKVKAAFVYPVLVLALTLVIGTGIAWFILPRLATVFANLKLDLPWITKVVIGLGQFLEEYGSIAVPAFLALVALLIYFIFFNKRTKFIGERILFSLPVSKRLIREIELARFGYILGTLLDAGMNATTALRSLEEATLFSGYKELYKFLGSNVEDGNSFKKSLDSYPGIERLVPVFVINMIASGEKSGNLASMLLSVGENYESKADITAKNLTVLLEPVLLVIVWLGVVVVALAVILPIYSLIGGLNP